MLKTLFVIGFVAIPLALAFILILYRARFFLLGIGAIVLLLMLIWGGLRIAAIWDDSVVAGSSALQPAGIEWQRGPA